MSKPDDMVSRARFLAAGQDDPHSVTIAELCDEIARLRALTEWQDISTAPRDGTHILVVMPWLPNPRTLFWATYADEWRCPASERGPASEGWQPTHWRPLPPSPEDT